MRLVVDVARTKGLEKSTLNGSMEGRSKVGIPTATHDGNA